MDPHGKHGSSIPSSSYGSVHPSGPIWERLTCTRTRLHEQHNLRMSSSLSKASEIVAMSPCSEIPVLRLSGNWTTSALCRRIGSSCRRRPLPYEVADELRPPEPRPARARAGGRASKKKKVPSVPPTPILSAQI